MLWFLIISYQGRRKEFFEGVGGLFNGWGGGWGGGGSPDPPPPLFPTPLVMCVVQTNSMYCAMIAIR